MTGALLVGRARELAHLETLLDTALTGAGSLAFVAGDPGIGKSRLLSRLAEQALGARVLWGRAVESGGAPAYWPFAEVIRELLEEQPPEEAVACLGDGAAVVAEIVAEARDFAATEPPPPLEPRQEQFRLFDAVASYLRRSARERPLLLLLDDLHAADAPTLALLEFLAGRLASSRILVVGSYRVTDARVTGAIDSLARAARSATSLVLGPLDETSLAGLVTEIGGAALSTEIVRGVCATSEGNPLFAVELAKLHASGGARGTAGERLPDTISAVIHERVRRLPGATARLLEVASIAGRSFSVSDMAAVAGESVDDALGAVDPAVRAGLVEEGAHAGTARFTHVLIAEVLRRSLSGPDRHRLHHALATILEQRHADDPGAPVATIAHHFIEAGPLAAGSAVTFSARAAERALDVAAYAEAVEHYQRALGALDSAAPHASARRCGLTISLGRALLLSGAVDAGQRACLAAAQLARELGEKELFARAALEHGAVFSYGNVDATLVSLLESALSLLGGEPSALRAKVLARLAAALQPASNPDGPIAMAREAIELARRIGDDRTLLEVTRSACSAMMDFAAPEERLPINREHIALARRLDDPVELLRGHARCMFDCLELGDVEGADREVSAHARIARALGQPAYEWRSSAFRALRAIMQGRFEIAKEHRARARLLSEQAADPNADTSLAVQQLGLARASFDDELARPILTWSGSVGGFDSARVIRAAVAVQLGDLSGAGAEWDALDAREIVRGGDPHMLSFAAEVAAALDDRDAAELVRARLEPVASRNVSWGMVGVVCDGPVAFWLGMLHAACGRDGEADVQLALAAERARALDSPPLLARVWLEHGARLVARGSAADVVRGREMLDRCLDVARRLRIDGLEQRVRRLHDPTTIARSADATVPSRRTPDPPNLRDEGDVWKIDFDGTTVRLASVKGMAILARLVAEPGREFHVLELVSVFGAPIDGDAGETIDATARDAYRRRAAELRDEIEDADARCDLGRAERAREELEAIARELERGLGLGGRSRRVGAAAERARTNVQKRLRAAQRRIAAVHPSLGEHLTWTVRTGAFCSYEPMPAQ